MKKIICAIFIIALFSIAPIYAEIPDYVRIGINASSLSETVSLSSDGGIYTKSSFAAESIEDVQGQETSTEENGAEESASYYIADHVVVGVSGNGTLLCNGVDTNETEVEFLKTSEFIVCQNKRYRGSINLSVRYGRILIVNVINIEDYLYGVVGREMSESFPLEALKAQSVAARNYTVISMGRHSEEGFDLCNGVHCQAYGAVDSEGENIRQAVDETSGKLLYYNGEVVQCYYYSSNGGYTESSENVWYSPLGYLKGKTDPYEKGDEIRNYYWSHTFTADEIKDCLKTRDIDIGEILDVKVLEYSENQHAIEVLIKGSKGTKSYFKDNIRAAFPERLESTLFTISKGMEYAPVKVLTANGLEVRETKTVTVMSGNGKEKIYAEGKDGEYTFNGRGNGHGVGMSQYGAMFMAQEGYSYEEILEFYFTDTEIGE